MNRKEQRSQRDSLQSRPDWEPERFPPHPHPRHYILTSKMLPQLYKSTIRDAEEGEAWGRRIIKLQGFKKYSGKTDTRKRSAYRRIRLDIWEMSLETVKLFIAGFRCKAQATKFTKVKL